MVRVYGSPHAARVTPSASFIHIPKTGGTYVTTILDGLFTCHRMDIKGGERLHHPPIQFLGAEIIGPTFAFVRHPLRWYESVWKMLHDYKGDGPDLRPARRQGFNFVGIAGYFWAPRFEAFIDNMLTFAPNYYTEVVQQFLGPKFDQVDHVGHTETLTEDLIRILDDIGFELSEITDSKRHGSRQHKNDLIQWEGSTQQERIMDANRELADVPYFAKYFEGW